jgi:hypothetical protein
MTLNEISNIRLINQRIALSNLQTAKEAVECMVAIQAQDFLMAKWAVGIRLRDPSDEKIQASLDNGEILRTHLLRPTWHFVSAHDIHWIIKLTAPQIISSMKSRHKQMELTDSIFNKSNRILEKTLSEKKYITREEAAMEFARANIRTDDNRLAHILFQAELYGLICSGPARGKKQTYALLEERAPVKRILTRDESLHELAYRYISSRNPATLHDFVWWSGLSVTDGKKALDSVRQEFITETIGSLQYLISPSTTNVTDKRHTFYLIPAFDEFLISYRDRSASLPVTENRKAVSINGIFYPLLVENGEVKGLWKRTIKQNRIIIETDWFNTEKNINLKKIGVEAARYGKFLNKETEVKVYE